MGSGGSNIAIANRVALFIALLCFAGVATAQPAKKQGSASWKGLPNVAQVPASLRKALRSYGKLRYSGTRVVEFRAGANRQRHTEIITVDGFRTRVEFPQSSPLSGQIVVENPKERRHYFPALNELRVLPPRREEAFGRIVQMAKRFGFTEQPGGEFAGAATRLVQISDPQGNVVQKLWIEPKSGMVLKRELYERSGTMVGFFEFSQFTLNPTIDPTDFALAPKGVKVVTPAALLARQIKKGGFQDVRLIDPAYHLESSRYQKIAGNDVLAQLYVGNGHRFTLYQLKALVNSGELEKQRRPGLNTFAWQKDGASFALVGDLSEAELKELARRLGA